VGESLSQNGRGIGHCGAILGCESEQVNETARDRDLKKRNTKTTTNESVQETSRETF
jgi:hypothetical protein